jgi:diguanylate cyclase (GGDEF)-like protein
MSAVQDQASRSRADDLKTLLSLHAIAISGMEHGLCVLDQDLRVVLFNRRCLEILGLSAEALTLGTSLRAILAQTSEDSASASTSLERMWQELEQMLARRAEFDFDRRVSRGAVVRFHFRPVVGEGWVCTCGQARASYEHAVHERNELLDAALEHMAHGLCAYDADLRVILVNRRYLEIYALDPEEARAGTPMLELMRRSIERGVHCEGSNAEGMLADLKERLIENREPVLYRQLADGRIIAVRHQPMSTGGWVGTYEDVTERHRAEKHIAHMARHDSLTDLPNRVLFQEKMAEGLKRVAAGSESMALLCLDLDNFKAINDSLGHPTGDKLLQKVAGRFRSALENVATVARLGGDEFAILQSFKSKHETVVLARQLIDLVSEPIMVDGSELNTGISIGIAVAPENGTTSDQLMKCADLALYRAKGEGRNTHRFFDPSMDVQLRKRRAIESDLRRALVGAQFHLVYQPQINLRTKEIIGIEALLRWNHPERGAIPPAEFIPVAEDTGLIVPIGQWVLRQACMDAAQWPASIRVAVNLSPVQFRHRALLTAVTHALAAAGLPASRLELEITEAVLMQQDDVIVGMLHQLRALGAKIAMDDFGTGYSSLSYIRSFPFDKIKIDRTFIADSSDRPEGEAIIRAIAELGASLGMETTAEGIETAVQMELVQRVGCTEGQGYLISRPLPLADILKFIARRGRPVPPALKRRVS